MFGRSEKKVDWERVDQLLEAGCLGNEIAACFDMHPHTFYDKVAKQYGMTFTDYQQEKRAKGDTLLREAQFYKAVKKLDNTMLVWLGKQRLGQKESVSEFSVSQEVLKPFTDIMNQMSSLQQSRNVESSSNDSPIPVGD